VKIDIRTDFSAALRTLDGLSDKERRTAIARTLNRIGEQTKVAAVREIGRDFNLPRGDIVPLVRMRRASISAKGELAVTVFAANRRGRSLNVVRFVEKFVTLAMARRRRKDKTLNRLRVQIKRGGGRKILGTPDWAAGLPFIATAKGGTFVAARTGKKRLPIRAVQTIDVAQMFNTKRINAALLRDIRSKFPAELNRQLAAVLRGY